MKSLYQFLIDDCNYNDDDANETAIAYDEGMDFYIPNDVKKDISRYWEYVLNSFSYDAKTKK